MNPARVTDHLRAWRVASLGDREIVEGIVTAEHAAPSPALATALAGWDAEAGSMHYWDVLRGERWLVLVRERVPPREAWWRPVLLFLLTLATTTMAGAILVGLPLRWERLAGPSLRAGLAFSLPLAAIMLAHESGHFVLARRYRVDVSLPSFIPFPANWNLIGTMGAFIRIRSPIYDRRTLFDIGIAGPLAGIAVALPVLLVGLALSHSVPIVAKPLAHQLVLVDGTAFYLGDSLLFAGARLLLGRTGTLLLHPIAMAGWVGVLVTALNLLPLAQFDGGHIAYAMSTRGQHRVSRAVWIALLALGVLWFGWWLWAAVALAVGRGRLAHPPVLAPERGLDPFRLRVGWATLALFALTLAPMPLAG